jgi:hypothetical protein
MNSYLLALYDISYSPAYKMTLHIRWPPFTTFNLQENTYRHHA